MCSAEWGLLFGNVGHIVPGFVLEEKMGSQTHCTKCSLVGCNLRRRKERRWLQSLLSRWKDKMLYFLQHCFSAYWRLPYFLPMEKVRKRQKVAIRFSMCIYPFRKGSHQVSLFQRASIAYRPQNYLVQTSESNTMRCNAGKAPLSALKYLFLSLRAFLTVCLEVTIIKGLGPCLREAAVSLLECAVCTLLQFSSVVSLWHVRVCV